LVLEDLVVLVQQRQMVRLLLELQDQIQFFIRLLLPAEVMGPLMLIQVVLAGLAEAAVGILAQEAQHLLQVKVI
jgi:hypothetical protein